MKSSQLVPIIIVALLIIGGGFYYLNTRPSSTIAVDQGTSTTTKVIAGQGDSETTAPSAQNQSQTIGTSADGRAIVAYHFGTGTKELLFIGGIHGGYEWNTVLVAQQLVDYLKANPGTIPSSLKVTVIPVLNPDGLNKVVGTSTGNFSAANVSSSQATQVAGRFNAHVVDLNRNFDCDWKPTGVWQSKTVSGGSAAFSEPESQAIQNYISVNKPVAAVVWYSSAGGVYSSSCGGGISSDTKALTASFANASGYPAHASFDSYATTGDMANWFAKSGIPAISVLLTNHTDTEWDKNLAGVTALLTSYSK